MRPTDLLRTAFAFAVLVLLHFSLRPLLGWRTGPDFLVIALLLVAIRVRPGTAALIGFVMGIIADSVTLQAFGAAALSMSVVGFAASWLKAVFFADDLVLNAFFFFLGKWAFDVLYVLAQRDAGSVSVPLQLLVWSPLTAAVTSAAGIITLILLRPVLRSAPT